MIFQRERFVIVGLKPCSSKCHLIFSSTGTDTGYAKITAARNQNKEADKIKSKANI